MKRLTPLRVGWRTWRSARKRGLTLREAFYQEIIDVAQDVIDDRLDELLKASYERGYREGKRDAGVAK